MVHLLGVKENKEESGCGVFQGQNKFGRLSKLKH